MQQTKTVLHLTPTTAGVTAKFFQGLGDPTRIKILQLPLEGVARRSKAWRYEGFFDSISNYS